MAFNPDEFFSTITVGDIISKFKHLKTIDFKEVSLNNELIKLNYEVVSKQYKDFEFSDIEQYASIEIDEIV